MNDTQRQPEFEPCRSTAELILDALKSDARSGLNAAEARERLAKYGRNELTQHKPVAAWLKLLAQFRDPLLIVAALRSTGLWVYERESALPSESLTTLAVVILNAVLGSELLGIVAIAIAIAIAIVMIATIILVVLVHQDGRRESQRVKLLAGETPIEGIWRAWPGRKVVLGPDRTEVHLADQQVVLTAGR